MSIVADLGFVARSYSFTLKMETYLAERYEQIYPVPFVSVCTPVDTKNTPKHYGTRETAKGRSD